MAEQWVLNASPLIVLAKINHQHLLIQLAEEIAIPQAVLAEINAGPTGDPARQFLATPPFPVLEAAPDPVVVAWDLGAGESAVLSHALINPGWTAVVDDGAALRPRPGHPFVGHIGPGSSSPFFGPVCPALFRRPCRCSRQYRPKAFALTMRLFALPSGRPWAKAGSKEA